MCIYMYTNVSYIHICIYISYVSYMCICSVRVITHVIENLSSCSSISCPLSRLSTLFWYHLRECVCVCVCVRVRVWERVDVYVWLSAPFTFIHPFWAQDGDDPKDALNCRSFFAKEPLIIRLVCRKWTVKTWHPMGLCHPVPSTWVCVCLCMCVCVRERESGCVRVVECHFHVYPPFFGTICVSMYVFVYVYLYVCMWEWMCTCGWVPLWCLSNLFGDYVREYVCVRVCVRVRVRVCVWKWMCTCGWVQLLCLFTFLGNYLRKCVRVRVCACV